MDPVMDPVMDAAKRPGASRGRGYSYNYVWLVTFTDLVALLLTFFVLMFAMSRVEYGKWQGFVHSLTQAANTVQQEEVVTPAVEYQVQKARAVPGRDLGYLAPVLREQVAADPALAGAEVRDLADRVVISFSGDALYPAGATGLAPKGERAVFAVGGVLRNLDNVIEVEASAGPARAGDDPAAVWQRALLRAAAVTRMLAEAGYEGPVVARGSAAAAAEAPAGQVDIVIRERAWDGG